MKARQKGKQDSKRRLESKYLKEAREVIKGWGWRKYIVDRNTGDAEEVGVRGMVVPYYTDTVQGGDR